jgi:hypothetical protein
MIQRIKDLMAMNEQVDVIKNNLKYTTSTVDDLKKEIELLKEHITNNISSVNEKNQEFFRNFDENINSIRELKHDFEKELFDFKLLRSQMQKKILERFEEELGKELKIQIEKLRADSDAYNEMKNSMVEMSGRINVLGEEIRKFTQISQNIKREDFEMTRFGRQLIDMDKEKLELMAKINSLQRLVGKMRRQEFITR